MAVPDFSTGDVPSESQVDKWMVNVTIAYKSADTPRASTITRTTDPHLTVTLDASTVYRIDGMIKYNAATAADISIGWSGTNITLFEWAGNAMSTAAGLFTDDQLFVGDLASTATFGGLGGSTKSGILLSGLIVVGGSAGTLSFQWAQGTSNATATTVYAYSYLDCRRVG